MQAFGPGDTLLLAVSGGMDSMALLHAAAQCAKERGVLPEVLHMDHALREESPEDTRFVEQYTRELGIPCHIRWEDVAALARENKLSVEDAGRQARMRFFTEMLRRRGAKAVWLAHHMDDQAETVLLHLLRGSGMRGLTGMEHIRADGIARPFLDTTRARIGQYVQLYNVPYITDKSNADTRYTRNRLRLDILPAIKAGVNPRASETLARTAQIIRAEDDYLHRAALLSFEDMQISGGLDAAALLQADIALSRRILRILCERNGLNSDLGFDHIEAVLDLCRQGGTGKRADLPHGYIAALNYGVVRVRPSQKEREQINLPLNVPGRTLLPGGVITVEKLDSPDAFGLAEDHTQYFSAEHWPCDVVVRRRQSGDRMHKLGAPGHKKFKDCLIDNKVLPDLRDMILLCYGDEVLWAIGFGIAHSVRVRPDTQSVLRITFYKEY